MAGATVSQNIASQREFLRDTLEDLTYVASRLWSQFDDKTPEDAVSNRPARIPFYALLGGKGRTGSFDGGPLGLGSGPTEAPGYLTCIPIIMAFQWSALSQWSTDSKEKAIDNYVVNMQKGATKQYASLLDALAATGDGSNTLTAISSTGTNSIVVTTNANVAYDNQDLDVWSALGGTFRGTITVLSVDIATNTLWTTGPLPAGTTAGDLLLLAGSAGQSGTGIQGMLSYQVAGNTGLYMNVPRSSFPGKFSTPTVANTGALVPAAVRALQGQIKLARGIEEYETGGMMVHCGVDMEAAWENNAVTVQRIDVERISRDNSADMLARSPSKNIAGDPLLVNEKAIPGRLDWLVKKHWFRVATKKIGEYEVGGQSTFPAYAADGGLASSMLSYIVSMQQLGSGQPRGGGYLPNVTVPHGFFGR